MSAVPAVAFGPGLVATPVVSGYEKDSHMQAWCAVFLKPKQAPERLTVGETVIVKRIIRYSTMQ
jgi:hypothetical protein